MTIQTDLTFITQYTFPPDAQLNDAGEVALKVWPPQQLMAQQTPSGKDYVFMIRADIALSWVDPQDVANLLERRVDCGCANGSTRRAFVYANEADVRRWTNGGGA